MEVIIIDIRKVPEMCRSLLTVWSLRTTFRDAVKNNPNGASESKECFIQEEIRKWVRHFIENHQDLYDATVVSVKVRFLTRHLDQNIRGIKQEDLKEWLWKIEEQENKSVEEENLERQSQEIYMDAEVFYIEIG